MGWVYNYSEKWSMWRRQAIIDKRHLFIGARRNTLLIWGGVGNSAAIVVVLRNSGMLFLHHCIKPASAPLQLVWCVQYRWKRLWMWGAEDPFYARILAVRMSMAGQSISFNFVHFSMQTKHLWRWPRTTAMPREQWFSASRYETTTQPGNWWHSSDLTLQSLAGNAQLSNLCSNTGYCIFSSSTHESLWLCCREALHSIFDEVCVVDVMDSGDTAHLAMMKRPDLGVTFTKLHCWTLTQYSKCVFMDADTLVRSKADSWRKPTSFLFSFEEISYEGKIHPGQNLHAHLNNKKNNTTRSASLLSTW